MKYRGACYGITPQGIIWTWEQAKLGKVRGQTVTGNVGRRRHMAWGTETIGGGWRVADVGDAQVSST